MKKLATICILTVLTTLTAHAKLRIIDIKETLDTAKSIKTVVVYGYSDSTMFYGMLNSSDTLEIDSKLRAGSEDFRRDLISTGMKKESDLQGKWPEVGDTVLLVINAKNRVALFAHTIKDHYRFWDPNSIPFANSVFVIKKLGPFFPLADCEDAIRDDLNYWHCFDGCLALKMDISEK